MLGSLCYNLRRSCAQRVYCGPRGPHRQKLTAMRIGILGGTFDPIHMGHLVVAEEARVKLGLDQVVFVPTGQPWLKVDRPVTPSFHRLEMVRVAIEGNGYFWVSMEEVRRPGPTYTVDTLVSFAEKLGPAKFDFIMGQDSFADFPMWKDPERVVELCRLVIVPRTGAALGDLDAVSRKVHGVREKTIQLDAPVIGISSSDLRGRQARGLSIRYLVPERVEQYIKEQGLYRSQA